MLYTYVPQLDRPDQYELIEAPFSHFAYRFREHKIINVESNRGKTPTWCEAFSPAEFDGGLKPNKHNVLVRGTDNDNVARLHFAVLDFDKNITAERFAVILQRFARIEGFAYTSFSHGKPDPESGLMGLGRWRLVMPFSRPVSRAEWPACWHGLYLACDKLCDDSCDDPRRMYYAPVAHVSRAEMKGFAYWSGDPEGSCLDVEDLIRRGEQQAMIKAHKGKVKANEDLDTTELTADEFSDFVDQLKMRRSTRDRAMAKKLEIIRDGKVFEQKRGQRDETLWKLLSAVAERFPNASWESVFAIFRPSLGATAALHGEPPNHVEDHEQEKVKNKFERAAANKLNQLEEKARAEHHTQTQFIREAFAPLGIHRETPYTDAELAGFAEDFKVTIGDLKKRWVIKHGQSCYIMVGGTYREPIHVNSLSQAAKRDLAPAKTAGVEIGDDDYLKTSEEILREYGTVARSALIDLTARSTYYDHYAQRIVEATCPLRNLPSENCAWIEAWLYCLAGHKVELLKDWISVVTLLDRAATILYMKGSRGIGKSLFINGLARLWTNKSGATDMATIFDNFNEAVTRCPLVYADEHMPKNLKDSSSAFLRRMQQDTTRKMKRKFHDEADMYGALRMVIMANNKDMLLTDENLTTDDVDAFIQRVLYIECPGRQDEDDKDSSPASVFLRNMKAQFGIDGAKEILENDALAKYALYLRDTRAESADRGRFFVHDTDNELEFMLTVQSGIRMKVCQWLCAWLLKRDKGNFSRDGVIVQRGRIYVTADAVYSDWDMYLGKHNSPALPLLARALEGLSEGPPRALPIRGSMSIQPYYAIRTEFLLYWAQRSGFASDWALRQSLISDSKISFDQETANVYNVTPVLPFKPPSRLELGLHNTRR